MFSNSVCNTCFNDRDILTCRCIIFLNLLTVADMSDLTRDWLTWTVNPTYHVGGRFVSFQMWNQNKTTLYHSTRCGFGMCLLYVQCRYRACVCVCVLMGVVSLLKDKSGDILYFIFCQRCSMYYACIQT